MGKDYTNKGEYQSNEHSADVFKAPKKKLTKEERKQQSDMKKRKYLDTGELDSKGNPLMIKGTEMSPEMQETYRNNPGYPKFNEGTKKVMEGTKRGSKERLKGLQENIGNYGRLAIKNANPTGMVLPIVTGAASLMIKGMQRQLLGI